MQHEMLCRESHGWPGHCPAPFPGSARLRLGSASPGPFQLLFCCEVLAAKGLTAAMRRSNAGSHTKQVTHLKRCFRAEFITRAGEARMQPLLSLSPKQRFGYGEQELTPGGFSLSLLSCSRAARCVHNPAVSSGGFGVRGQRAAVPFRGASSCTEGSAIILLSWQLARSSP